MTDRIICLKCGREGHHASTCKRKMAGYGSQYSANAEDGIQNALLAVLLHPEGLTGLQIGKLIGLGPDSAKSKLRELRRRGEVGVGFLNGNTWLWMLPQDAAAFRAKQYDANREKEIASRARRHQREKAALEAGIVDDMELLPITRRIVPAIDCPPLMNTGPRWVFEVAHA